MKLFKIKHFARFFVCTSFVILAIIGIVCLILDGNKASNVEKLINLNQEMRTFANAIYTKTCSYTDNFLKISSPLVKILIVIAGFVGATGVVEKYNKSKNGNGKDEKIEVHE